MTPQPDVVAVREMRSEDSRRVAELAGELGYPASESDIRRRYAHIQEHPGARVLVAETADGVVVGWIHVQTTHLLESDPRAEIWGLVVAESSRGSGVGRRLVEAAEEWVRALGLNVMALRSNTMRVGARQFYERLGYTVTKTQNAFRKNLS